MPKISTRYGVLEAFNPEEDLISRFLARYGEWAQYELTFVANSLSHGNRIADVGAFLGTFGLGIAKLKPVSKICFVDANPVVVPLLRDNVARNLDIPSVVLEAVVGGDGQQHHGTAVQGNMGSFSVAQDDVADRESSHCATRSTTLRSLSEQHGPFDLYKIDAEGMEGEILRQDADFLRETQSKFWLECNSTTASLSVAEYLLDRGFKVFYFAYPAISRENFNEESDREFPYAYEAGLWACKTLAPTISSELIAAGCVLKEITDAQALREALWLTPRWSPKEWDGRTLHEVVALASHALLGEEYSGFLSTPKAHAVIPRWADPLPVRLQERIDADARHLTKSEEMLVQSRQTHERYVAESKEVLAQLNEQLETASSQLREREKDVADLTRVRAGLELSAAEARDAERQLRGTVEKMSDALHATETELGVAKSLVRANEIMLSKERDRSRDAIKGLEAEIARVGALDREKAEALQRHQAELQQLRLLLEEASRGQDDAMKGMHAQSVTLHKQLDHVYRSRSMRMTMPLRMVGRLARGEWTELRRLMIAKRSKG